MYRDLCTRLMAALLLVSLCAPTVRGDLADDQYTVGSRHYAAARWELAAEEFRIFLERYPDHARAEAVSFFLGESLVQLERWSDAGQQCAAYLQRYPAGPHARRAVFRLGEAYYLSGRYAAARSALQQFQQAYPDDELLAYVLPYLGEIALVFEEPVTAQAAFSEALQRFPDGPLAGTSRYGLARALEAVGDDPAAMRFYRFLAEHSPRSAVGDHAALQLAILHYDRGEYDLCVQTLRGHTDRFPDSELRPHVRYWLGMAALGSGDCREAASTLEAAARDYPDHELVGAMLFHAADAHRQAGELAQAAQLWEQILAQPTPGPWADDSLQMLVQAAWEADDCDRVCALADRFAGEFATSPLRGEVEHLRARAEIKRGDYEAALRILEPLVQSDAAADENPLGATPSRTDADAQRDEAAAAQRPSLAAANRYYLALAYLGAQRHAAALSALDALADTPGPADLVRGVQVARATALVNLGRYAEARAPLEASVATAATREEADQCRAQLVLALARSQQWVEAEQTLAQLRQSAPGAAWYLATLECVAELAYRQHELPLARSLFDELSRAADAPEAAARGLSGLAWLAWQQDDAATTAQHCAQLLERFPDDPLAAEAAVLGGQARERLGDARGALDLYQQVSTRYPDAPHASTALLAAARVHDQLQQDDRAEALLRTWLEKYPASEHRDAALYQLAWVLIDQGRDDAADTLLAQIYAGDRHGRFWADATYRLAERAVRTGELQRADQLAGEIIDSGWSGRLASYALFLRGQIAAVQQRWEDVDRWMRRVVVEFPESSLQRPAQYWIAESRFRGKQFAEADRLLAELQAQMAGTNEPWLAMVALRRAQVQAHLGNWPGAHEAAAPIADRFPGFPQQHEVDYLLGRCHMHRGELDAARAAYERVIASTTGGKSETAAMAQWMVGETYFMQQQYLDAIKAYHRVEALYAYPQWQAAALLQAGKCYDLLGQPEEAIQRYTQILSEYPSSRVTEKAASRLRVARQGIATPRPR
ncbi:MAG: tetratricopeptide repeat protein [Pirellulaceae bacterium]|nr:tetratricopeptide repeat protein [Pirellulaceae bacterium]